MRATNMFRNFQEVRKGQSGAYPFDEKYILVVDENPLEAKALRGYLEDLGYSAKDLYNGSDALKSIQSAAPILIIASINIPGLKCPQLCQIVKGNPATASIPFMMLSSSDAHPDKALGFQQGCDDYITKPLDPGVLKSRVESLLRRSKQFDQIKLASPIPSITTRKPGDTPPVKQDVIEETNANPAAFKVKTVTDEKEISAPLPKTSLPPLQEKPPTPEKAVSTAVPKKEPAEEIPFTRSRPITPPPTQDKTEIKKSIEEFRAAMELSTASLKTPGEKPAAKELPYRDLSGYMDKLRSAADSFKTAHAADLRKPAVPAAETKPAAAPPITPKPPEIPPVEVKAAQPVKPAVVTPPAPERIIAVVPAEPEVPAKAKPIETAPIVVEKPAAAPSAVEEKPIAAPATPPSPPPEPPSPAAIAEKPAEPAPAVIETEEVIEPAFKKMAPEVKLKAEKSAKLSLPTRKQIVQANAAELYQLGHHIIGTLTEAEGKFGADEFLAITSYCDKLAETATASNELLSFALGKEAEPSLATHSVNCAIIALRIGKNLQVQAGELSLLCAAGLLFDLGMLVVDPKIRAKRGELSDSEYAKIKQHVDFSVELISQAIEADFPQECKYLTTAIAQHHERQEGQGYPHKLTGEKISRAGKILGIADTYEAMCHTRFHRSRQTTYRALQEVVGMKKTFFDPIVLRALVNELTFFPIGCYVRLNTEEIGVVIDVSPVHSMRPKIRILTDTDSAPLDMPKVVDLVQSPFLYVVKPLEDEDIPELV